MLAAANATSAKNPNLIDAVISFSVISAEVLPPLTARTPDYSRFFKEP
jgi:hypothetical protein